MGVTEGDVATYGGSSDVGWVEPCEAHRARGCHAWLGVGLTPFDPPYAYADSPVRPTLRMVGLAALDPPYFSGDAYVSNRGRGPGAESSGGRGSCCRATRRDDRLGRNCAARS